MIACFSNAWTPKPFSWSLSQFLSSRLHVASTNFAYAVVLRLHIFQRTSRHSFVQLCFSANSCLRFQLSRRILVLHFADSDAYKDLARAANEGWIVCYVTFNINVWKIMHKVRRRCIADFCELRILKSGKHAASFQDFASPIINLYKIDKNCRGKLENVAQFPQEIHFVRSKNHDTDYPYSHL